MKAVTFSARLARDLITHVESQGHDASSLRQILALPDQLQRREDIRVPAPRMAALWRKAMDVTDDRHVGLQMVIEQNMASLQTHSLIMQSSRTLKEAIASGIAYSALIANAMDLEQGETEQALYVDYKAHPAWRIEDAAVVFDLASSAIYGMFAFARRLVSPDVQPLRVSFEFAAPEQTDSIRSAFPCPIDFDQPVSRISFPRQLGARPLHTEDSNLLEALQAYGDNLFLSSNFGGSVTQRAASAIVSILGDRNPSLQTIAHQLNMSPRTLQRRIGEESELSFRSLVDEVRSKSAYRLLQDPERTVAQIGFLLGYADTTSFIRAYRRWHGHPPRRSSSTEDSG